MQTFQKPLSDEEEAYYLQMLKGNDVKQSEEARQILIESAAGCPYCKKIPECGRGRRGSDLHRDNRTH